MPRISKRNVIKAIIVLTFAVGIHAGSARFASGDGPAPKKGTAQFEIRFMKNMIDHHHMAVMMAELCEERAITEDLFELCMQIEEAQSAEIEEMQSWLLDWYGITYEPQMHRKMEGELEELAALEGEEFEIEFMLMMIEHHEVAIKEAQKCGRKAYHEELLELCHNIIETQSAEIALMESWLCDWYDICE